MFDWQAYLTHPDALSPEEATAIYQAIHPAQTAQDETFAELWQAVLDAALDYVPYRVRWNVQTQAEKSGVDAERTAHHNAFISALEVLNRYTVQTDHNDWLKQLGTRAHDRKRLGDFAGYLVLFGVLQGR